MNIQEKQEKEKRRKNQTKQDQHPEGEKVGYLFIRLLLQRDFLPPATSPALCSATTPPDPSHYVSRRTEHKNRLAEGT